MTELKDKEAITAAMMRIICPQGVALTDPAQVTDNLNAMLGEFGIDPEHAFAVGTLMMMAAASAQESPEDTVVQSFVVGIAVGCLLTRDRTP